MRTLSYRPDMVPVDQGAATTGVWLLMELIVGVVAVTGKICAGKDTMQSAT